MGLNILITLTGSLMVVLCVVAWGIFGWMAHTDVALVTSVKAASTMLAFSAVGVLGYRIARYGNRSFWKLFEDPPEGATATADAATAPAVAGDPAAPASR